MLCLFLPQKESQQNQISISSSSSVVAIIVVVPPAFIRSSRYFLTQQQRWNMCCFAQDSFWPLEQ
jgi:hypothetical protein